MKKTIALVLFGLVAVGALLAQDYTPWSYMGSDDGIDFHSRFGFDETYDGQRRTLVQVKVVNTQGRKVMVSIRRIRFSNGNTDYGAHLFSPNEDEYVFTFRQRGTVDEISIDDYNVDYYDD